MSAEKPKEVETSPDGRYVRYGVKLGRGAYKDVWKAYDTEEGIEVAWNTVNLVRMPEAEKKRIKSETEILHSIKHKHIMSFYTVWHNPKEQQVCFTTEIVASGTLKDYSKNISQLRLKVVKKWCRQILEALAYLHALKPPIIHRDLKCDNIFINGSTGEIRIGDFGLSSMVGGGQAQSVLGTPEFMAPELYDEKYSELVDIYAFGMCVLEMITKSYPYEECLNAVQIWKRVSQGQKPQVLKRILDREVRAFVEFCLAPADIRPTARDLLEHPFLSDSAMSDRDNLVVQLAEKEVEGGTYASLLSQVIKERNDFDRSPAVQRRRARSRNRSGDSRRGPSLSNMDVTSITEGKEDAPSDESDDESPESSNVEESESEQSVPSSRSISRVEPSPRYDASAAANALRTATASFTYAAAQLPHTPRNLPPRSSRDMNGVPVQLQQQQQAPHVPSPSYIEAFPTLPIQPVPSSADAQQNALQIIPPPAHAQQGYVQPHASHAPLAVDYTQQPGQPDYTQQPGQPDYTQQPGQAMQTVPPELAIQQVQQAGPGELALQQVQQAGPGELAIQQVQPAGPPGQQPQQPQDQQQQQHNLAQSNQITQSFLPPADNSHPSPQILQPGMPPQQQQQQPFVLELPQQQQQQQQAAQLQQPQGVPTHTQGHVPLPGNTQAPHDYTQAPHDYTQHAGNAVPPQASPQLTYVSPSQLPPQQVVPDLSLHVPGLSELSIPKTPISLSVASSPALGVKGLTPPQPQQPSQLISGTLPSDLGPNQQNIINSNINNSNLNQTTGNGSQPPSNSSSSNNLYSVGAINNYTQPTPQPATSPSHTPRLVQSVECSLGSEPMQTNEQGALVAAPMVMIVKYRHHNIDANAIKFRYAFAVDTPQEVAKEMILDFNLEGDRVESILCDAIRKAIDEAFKAHQTAAQAAQQAQQQAQQPHSMVSQQPQQPLMAQPQLTQPAPQPSPHPGQPGQPAQPGMQLPHTSPMLSSQNSNSNMLTSPPSNPSNVNPTGQQHFSHVSTQHSSLVASQLGNFKLVSGGGPQSQNQPPPQQTTPHPQQPNPAQLSQPVPSTYSSPRNSVVFFPPHPGQPFGQHLTPHDPQAQISSQLPPRAQQTSQPPDPIAHVSYSSVSSVSSDPLAHASYSSFTSANPGWGTPAVTAFEGQSSHPASTFEPVQRTQTAPPPLITDPQTQPQPTLRSDLTSPAPPSREGAGPLGFEDSSEGFPSLHTDPSKQNHINTSSPPANGYPHSAPPTLQEIPQRPPATGLMSPGPAFPDLMSSPGIGGLPQTSPDMGGHAGGGGGTEPDKSGTSKHSFTSNLNGSVVYCVHCGSGPNGTTVCGENRTLNNGPIAQHVVPDSR